MIKTIKTKYIFTFIIICLSMIQSNSIYADTYEQVIKGHIVDIDMSLFFIDKIFSEHQEKYLDNLSVLNFQKQSYYMTLKQYAKNFNLNLNHNMQICNKEFILNNDEKFKLIVTFNKIKKTDKKTKKTYYNWYIEDAFIKKNDNIIELHERGFSSKSFVRNFEDFLNIFKNNKINQYLSLAKRGKLNKFFIQKNTIDLSIESELIIKNVIIHKKSIIKDIIYFKFKYFSMGYKENGKNKSGWLLIDANSMSELYKSGQNLYIDYLLDRFKNTDKLELNKPNDVQNIYLRPSK